MTIASSLISLASNIRGRFIQTAPGVPAVVKQTVSLRVVGEQTRWFTGTKLYASTAKLTVCFTDIDEA